MRSAYVSHNASAEGRSYLYVDSGRSFAHEPSRISAMKGMGTPFIGGRIEPRVAVGDSGCLGGVLSVMACMMACIKGRFNAK